LVEAQKFAPGRKGGRGGDELQAKGGNLTQSSYGDFEGGRLSSYRGSNLTF